MVWDIFSLCFLLLLFFACLGGGKGRGKGKVDAVGYRWVLALVCGA
jgi:hypothetical protein